MEKDKYQRLSDEIYAQIGGIDNVESIIHCMTRLRIKIRDMSKVNITALKKIDGVLGVVEADTLEIVLGPGVNNKVAKIMNEKAGVKEGENLPSNT